MSATRRRQAPSPGLRSTGSRVARRTRMATCSPPRSQTASGSSMFVCRPHRSPSRNSQFLTERTTLRCRATALPWSARRAGSRSSTSVFQANLSRSGQPRTWIRPLVSSPRQDGFSSRPGKVAWRPTPTAPAGCSPTILNPVTQTPGLWRGRRPATTTHGRDTTLPDVGSSEGERPMRLERHPALMHRRPQQKAREVSRPGP